MAATIIYTVTMGTTIIYMAIIFTSQLDAPLSYTEHFGLLEKVKQEKGKIIKSGTASKHYIDRKKWWTQL